MRSIILCSLLSLSAFAGTEMVRLGYTPVARPMGCQDDFTVFCSDSGWHVRNETHKTTHRVPKHEVDPQLRDMSPHQLKHFITQGNGYLALRKFEDGSYGIQQRARMQGSGPVVGTLGYCGTKVLGYAIPVAGLATVGVKAFGTIAGSKEAYDVTDSATKESIKGASKIGARLSTTPPGTAGTACKIVDYNGHEGAEKATIAVATLGAGAVAQYAAYVEGAAATVGGFLTACPWLP